MDKIMKMFEKRKLVEDVKNIGFISTRIAGTDGVSLELEKWADVFRREGFNVVVGG